jgi:type VI secretion system protein ImpG
MRDEHFDYYERELAFMRAQCGEFATAHNTAARALLLGRDESRDPHVERLIEAFALIGARIQYRLDDQYPELTEGLLNVIYPHYLAPIPSMALVRFDLDPKKSPTAEGIPIPAGTSLRARPTRSGHICQFRTCYSTRVWPVQIQHEHVELRLEPPPSRLEPPRSARSWLRIELASQGDMTFRHLSDKFDRLRFCLCGQSLQLAIALYELIFRHGVGVRFSRQPPPTIRKPDLLTKFTTAQALAPAGFDTSESLLPPCDRSFPGYRLLTEFFAFPQKFLFFDLLQLDQVRTQLDDDHLEVAILLDLLPEMIHRTLRGGVRQAFVLGCVPAVNLFEKVTEPIALDHRRSEYRVVPDLIYPTKMEVYRVETVHGIDSKSGDITTYVPFYSLHHGEPRPTKSEPAGKKKDATYWHPHRRPSTAPGDEGTELFLSLVDLNFHAKFPADATLSVTALCTDRDEPNELSAHGTHAVFLIDGTVAPVLATCLAGPTPPLRPALRGGTQWRLISHLALNSLSIVDEPGGIDALKEMLRIYLMYHASHRSTSTEVGIAKGASHELDDPWSRDHIDNSSLVERLKSVHSNRVMRYVPSSMAGTWGRGIQIALQFDNNTHDDGKSYMFSAVLDRFFGLYASINSFTELVASTVSSTGEEKIYWTPSLHSGSRPIL